MSITKGRTDHCFLNMNVNMRLTSTERLFHAGMYSTPFTCSNTGAPKKESYDQPRQSVKKQRDHFADEDPYSQSYGFPSSHVQM